MTKRKVIRLFTSLLLALPLTGCLAQTRGNGVLKEETRRLEPFSALTLSGAWQVVIHCGSSENICKVTVEEELLEQLEFQYESGRLRVGFRGEIYATKPMKLEFFLPALPEEINVSGACRVEVPDAGAKERFSGRISGAVNFTMNNMAFQELQLTASGAPRITLKGDAKSAGIRAAGSCNLALKGELKQLDLNVSGASNVKIDKVGEATINLSGSGRLTIDTVEKLQGRASGAAAVKYGGAKSHSVTTSGAARVSSK